MCKSVVVHGMFSYDSPHRGLFDCHYGRGNEKRQQDETFGCWGGVPLKGPWCETVSIRYGMCACIASAFLANWPDTYLPSNPCITFCAVSCCVCPALFTVLPACLHWGFVVKRDTGKTELDMQGPKNTQYMRIVNALLVHSSLLLVGSTPPNPFALIF